MGALAVTAAITLDRPLVDPEGFLGPSWLRLPLLVAGAFLLDLLPRTLWASRMKPALMPAIVRARIRTHWDRERIILTVLGLVSFYITYVCYRNLKSFLPFIMGEDKYDRELHLVDRALMFGHEPATILHSIFGTGVSAHFLSTIYLWFLPLVPSATGSRPPSAWRGRSAPRPTTPSRRWARASSTATSTPTSPPPAPDD